MGYPWFTPIRIWKPKYNPEQPVPLTVLLDEMHQTRSEVLAFHPGKDQALLGLVYLFDPLFGFINRILTLQIGLYHDRFYDDDVLKLARASKE